MFDVHKQFRRRVHVDHHRGGISARIERQNSRGLYFWMMCLGTLAFVMFCDMILGTVRDHGDALYILPVLALAAAAYLIALAIAVWGAFGVVEIDIDAGTLRWKRSALKWSRVRDIPISDVTGIKAITPWHGFDNTVEVTTHRERLTFGDKLLLDEATELANRLRGAVGLLK